jgi:hypothetical protein
MVSESFLSIWRSLASYYAFLIASILSDNQVTVACATLGKLCQISLLPLRTEQHNIIIRDQYNQPSELHFDEPKNACTIRDKSL